MVEVDDFNWLMMNVWLLIKRFEGIVEFGLKLNDMFEMKVVLLKVYVNIINMRHKVVMMWNLVWRWRLLRRGSAGLVFMGWINIHSFHNGLLKFLF